MKVAAVALVLLIGAAVVLAFANTLNSWVLGGLIGGLAALLISIPISLVLFTILARRHDERQRTEDAVFVREEQAFDDYEGYQDDDYAGYPEVYETEAYVLPTEDETYGEARRAPGRRLADPRVAPEPPYPRLPAAGQSQASARASSEPRNYPRQPRQPARPQAQGRRQTTQHLHTRRPTRELQPRSERGMRQAEALRAARREAARQHEDDLEVIPTSTAPLRRSANVRPSQSLSERTGREGHTKGARPTRELYRRGADTPRAGRDINEIPTRRAGMYRGNSSDEEYDDIEDAYNDGEAETEDLRGRRRGYPQTGPARPQPRTGQTTRNPRLEERPGSPDTITGSLQNPLVRRAPYLYEDDPLRKELAQQIERPIIRRSSLYEHYDDEEEE